MPNQFPTPFPDLIAALARFLSEVQTVLGERFVGLYLHGSLAFTGVGHATDRATALTWAMDLTPLVANLRLDVHVGQAILQP